MRRASFIDLMFLTPSPPWFLGLQMCSHLTKQWNPLLSLLPFQKKPLLILSISLIAQTGSLKVEQKNAGTLDSTELRSTSRPPLDKKAPFQPAMSLLNFSMSWR